MARIVRSDEYGYPEVYIRETRNNYVAIMTVNGNAQDIPVDQVSGLRKLISEHNVSHAISVKVENRPYVIDVPECSYCAARPVVGEMDCDGFYWRATCETEQCNPGDVRRGRHNLSASNRARGFDG